MAVVQDSSDIIWQKYIWPHKCGDAKFSPDGEFIYAAIDSQIVKLSAETGDSISTFEGKHNGLDGFQMDISSLGNFIVTKDYLNNAMLWDCKKEKLILNLSTTGGFVSTCICIDPLERYILIGSGDYFTVYDLKTFIKITSFNCTGIKNSSSTAVKFSHDGSKFLIVSWSQANTSDPFITTVTLWETGTWKRISELYSHEGRHQFATIKLSFDDKYLGYVDDYNSKGYIIDIISKKILLYSDLKKICVDINFSPNIINCIFCYYDNKVDQSSIEIWDILKLNRDKTYIISSNGITSDYTNNSNQFFINGHYWLTLMKPYITGIKGSSIFEENLKINYLGRSLVLECNSELLGNCHVTILELSGKILHTQDIDLNNIGTNKLIIDLNLFSGIYICQLIVNNRSISQKFEIVR